MLEPKSAIPPGWFYMAHLPVVALRLPPANSFEAFGFIIQNADLEIPPTWPSVVGFNSVEITF